MLIDDFRQFVSQMIKHETQHTPVYRAAEGLWWYSSDTPDEWFNKEIVESGLIESWPEGAVGIRCDENFWEVAAFPLKFRDLSIQDMVAILWPEAMTSEMLQFGPDYITKSEDFQPMDDDSEA